MRALDHCLPGQGRRQGGGGEGVCASLRFSGTRGSMAREGQDSGGGNRNPHISHEICAETDNKARQGSRDPSDHLVPRENRAPLTIIRGPPNCQGPYEYKWSCEHQGPSDKQGPF